MSSSSRRSAASPMGWRRCAGCGVSPARAFIGTFRRRHSPPRRRGPLGAMSDAALTAAIQGVLAASPFHGEGHRKVWARLRHAGTRTSLRRVLRLMREHGLLAPAGSVRRADRAATTAPSFPTRWTQCGARI